MSSCTQVTISGLLLPLIEDGFVQAAIARRAVDGEVLMPSELSTSVMKNLTAAGRLIDWVAPGGMVGRDLPRAGNGGLRLRLGGAGRQR